MLSKYSNEEIIQLARQNPGYGLIRMIKILYPAKKSHKNRTREIIITILQDHEEDIGEDLFSLLQDPSYGQMVTRKEYTRITGAARPPRGTAGSAGGRSSKADREIIRGDFLREVFLPPQEFNWGEIIPEDQRDSHQTRSFEPQFRIKNVGHDYRKIWEMHMDGYSRGDIHRDLDMNRATVGHIVKDMETWNEAEALDDWLEVIDIVNWFSSGRGHESHKDAIQDEVIIFMRTEIPELTNYIQDPTSHEKPDLKELISIYHEVCEMSSEEQIPSSEDAVQHDNIEVGSVNKLPLNLPLDFPTTGVVVICHKKSITHDNPEGREDFFISTQALQYLSNQVDQGKIRFDLEENGDYIIRYV